MYPKIYRERNVFIGPLRTITKDSKQLRLTICFFIGFVAFLVVSAVFSGISLLSLFRGFIMALPYLAGVLILWSVISLVYPKGKIVFDEKGFVITKGLKRCEGSWGDVIGVCGSVERPGNLFRQSYIFIRTNKKDSALLLQDDIVDMKTGLVVPSKNFIWELESLSGKQESFEEYHLRPGKRSDFIVEVLIALIFATMIWLLHEVYVSL